MNTIKIPELKIGEYIIKNKEVDFSVYGKKAYIITDNYMVNHIDDLKELLKNQNIDYVTFSDITGEPTDVMLENSYRDDYDFLIGIGGGSALDSAKLIACKEERKPFILIPTTAGTGSEVTKFSILTYVSTSEKKLIVDDRFIPDMAILDYSLTYSMPAGITAATGLDAFCHALEAYTSRKHNPVSDTFALSALRRIIQYLPASYLEGNEKARQEMALAALEAGVAFNHSSVTIIHGMSRPIGAQFHIPHGISNAMLLDVCMPLISSTKRFPGLLEGLGYSKDEFLDVVTNLCQTCKIQTLKQYGVDEELFDKVIDKMSDDALNSGSPQNTYCDINKDMVVDLYHQLMG